MNFQMLKLTSKLTVLAITVFCIPTYAADADWKMQMNKGVAARQKGKNAEAASAFSAALKEAQKTYGANDSHVVLSMHNLAQTLTEEKKTIEAEKLFKDSAAISEKLNDKHLLALSWNNLGAMYLVQNKFSQAETAFNKTLMLREKSRDAHPEELAAALDNMGMVYRAQGNYEKAESLYKRSLPIWTRAVGADHPDTATCMNNLAALYYHQKKYAEAEPLFKKALVIREKMLGLNDPDTISCRTNLALSLRALGKLADAEKLIKQNPQSMHPDISNSTKARKIDSSKWLNYMELGIKASHAGNQADAEKNFESAVKVADSWGIEDKRLAASLYNLGRIYLRQNKLDKAEPLYVRSIAISNKVGGSDPETLMAKVGLASLYMSKQNYKNAIAILKNVITIQEKKLGDNHPEVATTMHQLAVAYSLQGQYGESEKVFERVIAILEAKVPPNDPELIANLEDYLVVLKRISNPGKVALTQQKLDRARQGRK